MTFLMIKLEDGRAIAYVFSPCLLTAVAWLQSQCIPRGICGGHCGVEAVVAPNMFYPVAHYSTHTLRIQVTSSVVVSVSLFEAAIPKDSASFHFYHRNMSIFGSGSN